MEAENAAIAERACRTIEMAEHVLSLAELAEAAELSPGYFHRLFKSVTGLTPKAYAMAHRAGRVRDGLRQAETVTAAIYEAGFSSDSRFYEGSTALLGMKPSAYRAGGARERLCFAVGQCSLGAILVASSNKGVAAILLGDDPDALARDLQDRFPHAELIGGDGDYEVFVARVVGLVEAPGIGINLPMDVRGTAFQQRVWQALREVPAGATVTYSEIARRIGTPAATRAVAGACAANHIAVAIPCHRGHPQRRCAFGLPMGRRAQAPVARPGERSVSAADARVAAIDGMGPVAELDAQGWTILPKLLSADECAQTAALYDEPALFRSHVIMARHGFGRGEYRYFSYPLPPLIAGLRPALYAQLAPIANRWHERMGIERRIPADHSVFLDRCHEAGQARPTPLMLRYGAGDYNCLHQDLYGEHVFPLQVAILLSAPGDDFAGGEFVLTEQRPRMQSRAEVVPLTQGDAVVFAVNSRPQRGSRGDYRVTMRHGVSRLRAGHRHTLGIIFHDAA